MNAPSLRAILEKPRPLPRTESPPASPLPAEAEPAEVYTPFASGRIGNRPQLVLLFRQASGAVRGFSYSYFYGVESNNSAEGFVIDFTHVKVQVVGQNLQQLFRLVCEQRVAEIVELGRSDRLAAAREEPVVERIDFQGKS